MVSESSALFTSGASLTFTDTATRALCHLLRIYFWPRCHKPAPKEVFCFEGFVYVKQFPVKYSFPETEYKTTVSYFPGYTFPGIAK
jgi:hypothetical protein